MSKKLDFLKNNEKFLELKEEELHLIDGGKLSKAQCAYFWGLCLSGAAQAGSVGVENTCKLANQFC